MVVTSGYLVLLGFALGFSGFLFSGFIPFVRYDFQVSFLFAKSFVITHTSWFS